MKRSLTWRRVRDEAYGLGVTAEEVEQVQGEVVGVVQREVGHSVVDADEDAADDQLFDVRLVDVRGAVRGVALARPEWNDAEEKDPSSDHRVHTISIGSARSSGGSSEKVAFKQKRSTGGLDESIETPSTPTLTPPLPARKNQ